MEAVVASLMAPGPTENTGMNSGRPFAAGAATAGTIVGEAGKVVMSMLSAPTRNWPEPKLALVRSMLKLVEVRGAKGAAVPVPVQLTTRLAGTVGSAFTAWARKSGGADPKGLVKPSTHDVSPAFKAGSVSAPVFTR